jgi:hypothetical protein
MKAADWSISKGAYLSGLDLLKQAAEVCRNESEVKLVLQVLNKAIRDLSRMSGKKTKRSFSSRSYNQSSRTGSPGEGESGEGLLVDTGETFSVIVERDFISEYKKLKSGIESHQLLVVDPHSSTQMTGPLLMRKSASLFSSAFGDDLGDGRSAKGQLGFQLSYTAPNGPDNNTNGGTTASPAASDRAPSGCGCIIT